MCVALLNDTEELGRSVFDGEKAKKAGRGKIAPRIFEEKPGVPELSLDRLSIVDHKYAANIQTRLRSRECLGWAVVDVKRASLNGRSVKIDPVLPDQLHHANILLPLSAASEEEQFHEQKEHALDLALAARWQSAQP